MGHPLGEPKWQPYVFAGVHQPIAPPPFFLGSGRTSPVTIGLFCLDGLESDGPRIYQEEYRERV
jgi:hypothetical protein